MQYNKMITLIINMITPTDYFFIIINDFIDYC